MPKVLVTYVRCIEAMHKRLGKTVQWGVFLLIGILLIEAISRYIFDQPTVWSVELAEFVFGTYYLIGGGYVLLSGRMVRMDALYSRWSSKRKAIVDLITFGLVAVYLVSWITGGITNVAFAINFNVHSSSLWGPPLAPMRVITLVAAALILLELVALFIRDLSIVLKGKEPEGVPTLAELEVRRIIK
jgi:TRAP-type mannitol/chloroaromatic compound transport system permease small subunit